MKVILSVNGATYNGQDRCWTATGRLVGLSGKSGFGGGSLMVQQDVKRATANSFTGVWTVGETVPGGWVAKLDMIVVLHFPEGPYFDIPEYVEIELGEVSDRLKRG